MSKSIAVILLISLMFNCDPPGDHRLKYVNTSNKYLLLNWGFEEYLPFGSPFRDMRVFYRDSINKKDADVLDYFKLIKPHQVKMISTGTGRWESIFQGSRDKKLTVHIFDFQTIETTKWDSIRKKNLYDEKDTLSLDSLERIGWTLKR